jgi:hypothetical protein
MDNKPDEIIPPNIKILLNELRAEIFSTLNCVQIGKIEKVTASAQTVEISLQIKRLAADGTSTAYPVLVDCPYFVLQGGGAYIDMPIKPGDYCIVLFNDRCIDSWWSTANVADPPSTRKHSFSDALAIVGLNPKPSPRAADGTWARLMASGGTEKEAARKGDTAKLTMSGTDIQALAVALLATGGFTPASAPAPSPTPVTFTGGEITGGSSKWKIG